MGRDRQQKIEVAATQSFAKATSKMLFSRKLIIQIVSVCLFLTGVGLLLGGTVDSPITGLIISGILCILASAGSGFAAVMEPAPLLPISATSNAANA